MTFFKAQMEEDRLRKISVFVGSCVVLLILAGIPRLWGSVVQVSKVENTAFEASKEFIEDWSTNIEVDSLTAGLTVKEIIQVHARGTLFKHGLFRLLPQTLQLQSAFLPSEPDAKVFRQVRSYRAETLQLLGDKGFVNTSPLFESRDGYSILALGDPNKPLAPGLSTFVATYSVQGAVSDTPLGQELTWILNNPLPLPIRRGELQVVLPKEALMESVQSKSYFRTDRKGEKGTSLQIVDGGALTSSKGSDNRILLKKSIQNPIAEHEILVTKILWSTRRS